MLAPGSAARALVSETHPIPGARSHRNYRSALARRDAPSEHHQRRILGARLSPASGPCSPHYAASRRTIEGRERQPFQARPLSWKLRRAGGDWRFAGYGSAAAALMILLQNPIVGIPTTGTPPKQRPSSHGQPSDPTSKAQRELASGCLPQF